MTDPENSSDNASRSGSRWLWLSALTTLALIALINGRLLFASGMLLLGVFAFFNNPLSPASSHIERPATVLALSWACGFVGVTAVLAAAVRPWL